ncbi:hypothetical protein JHK82_018216 [Glycine max]|nr:hypothetical protein JHK85_018642 [Glycine max]KAG5037403.1 hypothetical protein JHK86_018243 [Glycine max]KAG5142521.1 hypothetical protein JHK82_018216 [Glycine max]
MSLNCLACGQILQRVNSDRDDECLPPQETKTHKRKVTIQVDRSWSANMTPPKCARSGPLAKVKTQEHHRRTNSEGNVGPRLVRSSGMRRDWSFEDLAGQQDKGVIKKLVAKD